MRVFGVVVPVSAFDFLYPDYSPFLFPNTDVITRIVLKTARALFESWWDWLCVLCNIRTNKLIETSITYSNSVSPWLFEWGIFLAVENNSTFKTIWRARAKTLMFLWSSCLPGWISLNVTFTEHWNVFSYLICCNLLLYLILLQACAFSKPASLSTK